MTEAPKKRSPGRPRKSTGNGTYRYEKDLQKRLIMKINFVYKKNVWFYKTNDMTRIGVPDIVMCFYGHFVAIELKRKPRDAYREGTDARRVEYRDAKHTDSDVSPMQTHNIKRINMAGGSAFVGRAIPTIMERLEKLKNSLLYFKG